MELTYLLKEAVMDINNIRSYYSSQLISVDAHIKEELPKYALGVMLDRFFMSLIVKDDELVVSDKEKEVVDKILEHYSTEEQDGRVIIKYKYKEGLSIKNGELNPEIARGSWMKLVEQPSILGESTLMMLLVKYEAAIAGVFRELVENFPQAYLKDKSITYSELVSLSSDIEDIKKRFVDKEVDEFMRRPIGEWYQIFEGRHKAIFLYEGDEFDDFKEIYYRRNIIVHNQGLVNNDYLNGVPKSSNSVGDFLSVDEEYMNAATGLTLIVLYSTFWGLRKIASDAEELVDFMFDQGFKYMTDGEWAISKFVFWLLMQDKDQNDADALCSKINYWISRKNYEGIDSIKNEVEQLDVSAMQSKFIAAKYALIDEHQKVAEVLDRIIDSEIPASYIETWPLFIQFRESDEYISFLDKHRDAFKTKDYESDVETVEDTEKVINHLGVEVEDLVLEVNG